MKILLVHNNYGVYSGEEAVVDSMVDIYLSLGYKVAQYRKSTESIQNDIKGKIDALIRGIFPFMNVAEFRASLERHTPDVIHIHNLYPFIGAAILRLCKSRGVRVIMTVHNYRLSCPTGLFMRDEHPCEECLHLGGEWSCIKHNCEGSIFKSVGYAMRNMVSRKNRYYIDNVDMFCCLTEFQRNRLMRAGFDPNKIIVIPNSRNKPLSLNTPDTGDYVGYCGRLSTEKGIDLLFEVARRNPNIEFRFAGAARVEEENIPSNCILMGHIRGEEFDSFINNARFMVMASRCYEGFPMAIVDSISHGKCVIAPDHGGFTEIIKNDGEAIGELFTPHDVDDLERRVVALWGNKEATKHFAYNGEKAFAQRYSKKIIKERWREVVENNILKRNY